MRWGSQEKGCEAGPSAKGEEGQGCADGDDVESSKRVGNIIQSMDHWEGGVAERQGPPPSPDERSLYTIQHFTAWSFTSHSTST